MDKEEQARWEALCKELEKMPYKAQEATAWLIDNVQTLDVLLKGEKPDNLEEKIKEALKKGDYYLYQLLLWRAQM